MMSNLHKVLSRVSVSVVCLGMCIGVNVASAQTITADKFVAGGGGMNGKINVKGAGGFNNLQLKGANGGNITNKINGSGTVKAWAKINSNGTINACWRCNTSATQTRKLSSGTYEVDFTPVTTDLTSRPWTVSKNNHGTGVTSGSVNSSRKSGDTSSIFVRTRNESNVSSDSAFTVILY